jgi:hypothetical protein
MAKTYRIVHWGTGAIGSHALRSMLERKDYEIVGHYVHNPTKAGQDSGELVGAKTTGLVTTRDMDALIALKPDVLAYFGNAMADPMQSVRDMARFLEAGINVVSPCIYEAMARETTPKEMLEIIEPACKKGNSTFYSTGCDPGIMTSQLPVTMLGAAHRVDRMHLQEFADYGLYPDPPTVREYMGFGKPLGTVTAVTTGDMLRRVWLATVAESVRALGLETDDYRTTYKAAPAKQDRDTAAVGKIAKGTTSAMWFQLIGVVAGKDRVILEHVNWIHTDDIPADWPQPVHYDGKPSTVGYRVLIKGDPSFNVEVQIPGSREGMFITATHTTNSIPTVVAAPPGIMNQAKIAPYGIGRLKA